MGENSQPTLRSMNTQPEVNIHMIGWIRNPLLEVGGPILHWIGPETLVDLTIEGRNINALVDSGSQVNMIIPTLVQQYGFPVLPLEDLVDHPMNPVGLGRKCTSPLGFIILQVQVWEIAGYNEDIVFLMVPDASEFGQRVPLVIGTCTIGQIIKIIRKSEIDHPLTPWATVRVAQLLSCWKSTAALIPGSAETQAEGASGGPQEVDMDELVMVRESNLAPFQTKIIEGWVRPLLGDTAHIMITLLRVEGQPREGKLLPLGLHSFMRIRTSRTAAIRCSLWSGMFLTATSSSRRECWWHGSCQHHWCHLLNYCQRWKPL